jgi:hypothetical protein
MWRCFASCLAQIPWWAWIILAFAGAVFALLVIATGGIANFFLPVWLQALLAGLGPFGVTALYCIQDCTRQR